MSRRPWTLHAYQAIEPDEQLDLFACHQARVHLVVRQLVLAASADRTLCGSLLPAAPAFRSVAPEALDDPRLSAGPEALADPRLCRECRATLRAHRQGEWHLPEPVW